MECESRTPETVYYIELTQTELRQIQKDLQMKTSLLPNGRSDLTRASNEFMNLGPSWTHSEVTET